MLNRFFYIMAVILPLFSGGLQGRTNPEFLWSVDAGGDHMDFAYDVATDINGYSYITGYFNDTALFGSHEIISCGSSDIFIARMDADGSILWAQRAGGTGEDSGWSIAVDNSGNSYITGYFEGTAYFGDIELVSMSSGSNSFAAKLDINGSFEWAVSAESLSENRSFGIAVDNQGNSYITGRYIGTIYFGDIEISSSSMHDIFTAKIDSEGSFIWANNAWGGFSNAGNGIAVDNQGNSYITGTFQLWVRFGNITLESLSDESDNSFIAKIGSDGNYIWAKLAGAPQGIDSWDIAADNSGNAYITGCFYGPAYFDDIVISSGIYSAAIFISRIDANGNFLWARKAGGGTGIDSGRAVSVDNFGNLYITGSISGTADFDDISLESSGEGDIFVAKSDSEGNFRWAKKAGGAGYDGGMGISVDNYGNSYICGYFEGTAFFDEYEHTSRGESDIFTAKVDPGEEAQVMPVYRFFNTVRGGHLYTISGAEMDYITENLPQWHYEGVKFNVDYIYVMDSRPVYRFFNTRTGIHLYTISENERDDVMVLPQWNYEGVKFYVHPDYEPSTIPVFRFFNNVRGGHLYTVSEIERDAVMQLPGWTYEGIPFYVYPLEVP